jgi:broad specificity phosphatase PhoE
LSAAYFITHPDVVIDPAVPITQWPLSENGRLRMRKALALPWTSNLTHILSSTEQKAIDGTEILSDALNIPHDIIPELGENDRSATGFLPPIEFWDVVKEFFAHPDQSIRGWETATHAQQRVLGAVRSAGKKLGATTPIAFVSHGGGGCLLLAHLAGKPISRDSEQPAPPTGGPPGSGGGYYFTFDLPSETLLSGWRPIDP